jgi:hypothetical protein
MRFLVNMFNHSELGQRSLEDVVGIFGHQVRALGHDIIWDQKNQKFYNTLGGQGINIVVEGFTESSIQVIANAHAQGCRFIILATEEPCEEPGHVGFNQGTQREMVYRQKTFPEAAKFSDGIIHLVPGEHVTRWYGQFAPTSYTELGYAPTLERPDRTTPRYDYGFYGSVTKRRMKILRKLAKYAGYGSMDRAVRIVPDFKEQIDRDRAMRDVRVVVQIRKFDEMGLVSSSRCNTALCLGRPVVAEPHLLSKPWDEIVTFAPTIEAFYNSALMARSAWRGIHADQMNKFKNKLPPAACAGAALAKLGVVEKYRDLIAA